jgi:ATP-binding cassette subfamily C protein CydC
MRVWRLIKPYRRRLIYAGVLSSISLMMAVGLLAVSAWLISMASTQPPILVLQVAIVGVRFFGLGRGVFKYFSRLLEHDAALRIQSLLRVEIFIRLERYLPTHFANLKRGSLLRQVVNETEEIQDLWLRLFLPWLSALIAGICGVGIILWLLPTAAIAIFTLFAIAIISISLISALSSARVNYRAVADQIFDQVMQACDAAKEAQVFAFADQLQDEISQGQLQLDAIDKKESKSAGIGASLQLIFTGTAVITGFILATTAYQSGDLAGINIAVITLLPIVIFDNLNVIPTAFAKLRPIKQSLDNLDLLLAAPVKEEGDSNYLTGLGNYEIQFSSAMPVLANISFASITGLAKPGEPLLIMGKSGSGKSSLLYSTIGFLPYSGSIKIGDIELSKISNAERSNYISILLQDDYLFNSSIRENLRIGNSEASDQQLMQVLEIVELTDLINSLPDGLDTHIGAYGYNFSGGEKQRMKLARLLLRDTPIYLLDEPFEYLDKELFVRISKRVQTYLATKTLVVVSHLAI